MANKKITELTVTTTLTGSEVSEVVQGGVNKQITKSNEKTFYTTDLPSPTNPQDAATKAYAESLVVGLWDDRGNFDASVNAYPSLGGSGTAGAIMKGDIWTVSVGGTLPTGLVVSAGDTVRALVNTPGNTQSNWAIAENNIGYVPENQANKENTTLDTSTTKYPTNRLVKEYVDNATPNASETVKGIVEEATDAETSAGTAVGATGAKLFVTPTKLNTWFATKDATPSVKGIAKLYNTVDSNTDGAIDQKTALEYLQGSILYNFKNLK